MPNNILCSAAPEHPLLPPPLTRLRDRIESREAVIAVVGLGYVGLPLLVAVAEDGFPTIGLDVDETKVASLRAGSSHIVDVTDATVAALGRTSFTTDSRDLALADVIVIAVPTPLHDGTPDLALVRAAVDQIAEIVRSGQLIVLESTTYPGTTEELVLPALEARDLTSGLDIAVAYSPERVNPGSSWGLQDTPKVVGGIDAASSEVAAAFYGTFVPSVHRTRSSREAEMAKLIENTFRQVNIALVNELATVAGPIGVDLWDALDAAATKPFGYLPFWPGAGVGGHCIAVDPSYLSWRVERELGFGVGFISHARSVNSRMPSHVTRRIAETLNDHCQSLRGSRIHLLGLTYKPGVNDVRESPALAVAEHLAGAGAMLSYTDPFVPEADVCGRRLVSSPLTAAEDADLVVVLVCHPVWDRRQVLELGPPVFDVSGAFRSEDHERVVLL